MKSISLDELKRQKESRKPFELLTVHGMEFVARRQTLEQYLEFTEWYLEGNEGEKQPQTATFEKIITDTICVDEGGAPLFTNGSPLEYLEPADVSALGTEVMKFHGMWTVREAPEKGDEKGTAKN